MDLMKPLGWQVSKAEFTQGDLLVDCGLPGCGKGCGHRM